MASETREAGKRSSINYTRPRRADAKRSFANTRGRTEPAAPPRRGTKTTALSAKQARLLAGGCTGSPGPVPGPQMHACPRLEPGREWTLRSGPQQRCFLLAFALIFLLAQSPRSRQPKALNLNGSRSANSADSRAPGLGGAERADRLGGQRAEARRGLGRGGRRCAARGARGAGGGSGGPLGACTMELALSPPPPASRPGRAGSRFHVTCTKRNGFWGRPEPPSREPSTAPGTARRPAARPGCPAASGLPPPPRQVGDRRERTWAAARPPPLAGDPARAPPALSNSWAAASGRATRGAAPPAFCTWSLGSGRPRSQAGGRAPPLTICALSR